MTQTQKVSMKTSLRPLFLRKSPVFGRKFVKIPAAVTIHGENFAQKKFTGKELDAETGLYYFGARYLDPKTGRWISGDPAVSEYISVAPVSDEARRRNGSLPGMGGVFNVVNLHVYHYAGNNPVRYIDPDGEWTFSLGLSGGATYGVGVQGSIGIAFGYSKGKGFSFGVYVSKGGNFGTPSAGIGVTGSFSLNTESVRDLDGTSGSTGGGMALGPGVAIDINTKDDSYLNLDPASGVSVTIGIKGSHVLPAEGHTSISETTTFSTSFPEIIQGMEEIKQEFEDFVIRKILEQIPQ
jgi:RHS repeat-associated protein